MGAPKAPPPPAGTVVNPLAIPAPSTNRAAEDQKSDGGGNSGRSVGKTDSNHSINHSINPNASTCSSGRSVLVPTPPWAVPKKSISGQNLRRVYPVGSRGGIRSPIAVAEPGGSRADGHAMMSRPLLNAGDLSSVPVVKKIRPPEEDLLSDISSNTSPSAPSSRNSQVFRRMSGGQLGLWGHKGEEIEQERNRMPLSIEEDLFVYDDIVISKDEAQIKHWRLAGRKIGLDSQSGSRRNSTAGKTTTFSFNDFDVCVDEMELAPSTSFSAAGVKALLESLDTSASASSDATLVLGNNMSVTWTQMRRRTKEGSLTHSVQDDVAKKMDRVIRNYTCTTLRGHASRVKCLSLAPSETEFVSCSNEDASVMLNSFTLGDGVRVFAGHTDTVICTAFSPDGKMLATCSKDRSMMLWDVMLTKVLLTYKHSKVVICCCFSPDSRYLVSGCQDRVCRVWDTRRGKDWLMYTQHEGIIVSMDFSPDSNYICSASADSTLRVWSSTTAKTKLTLTGHKGIILSCNYLSDGTHIVSNDETQVRVWDAEDGSCKLILTPEMLLGTPTFTTPNGEQRAGWTLSTAAPGGFNHYIVVACNNRFVYVIDCRTGEEVLSTFCKAPVYCLSSGWKDVVSFGDSFGNVYMLQLR